MLPAVNCVIQDIDLKVSNFLDQYSAYRTLESQAADSQESNPELAATLRGGRAQPEAGMQRAMARLAELRDQVIEMLDTLVTEGEALVVEHGEGSPEHEAHERRYQDYLRAGEAVQAAVDRVLLLWEARDQPDAASAQGQ